MIHPTLSRLALFFGFAVAAACSSTDTSTPPATSSSDGGATNEAGASDASTSSDASASDFSTCEGACATTALTVTFDGKSEPLTRAQFGFVKGDGGALLLHLEAHDGGSPACPTSASPTTDRTLVFEDLPIPKDGTVIDGSAGVRAAFFDFKGTLLPSTPLAKATSVKLTPKAAISEGGALSKVAFDVTLTFPSGGTLSGHLFAEHCATMD